LPTFAFLLYPLYHYASPSDWGHGSCLRPPAGLCSAGHEMFFIRKWGEGVRLTSSHLRLRPSRPLPTPSQALRTSHNRTLRMSSGVALGPAGKRQFYRTLVSELLCLPRLFRVRSKVGDGRRSGNESWTARAWTVETQGGPIESPKEREVNIPWVQEPEQ
jgi:hypothetical protein